MAFVHHAKLIEWGKCCVVAISSKQARVASGAPLTLPRSASSPAAAEQSQKWPSAVKVGLWCRDSTGRFLPVMSQNATWFHCFSGLTPLPGICGSLVVLAGPEADLAVWVFLRAD